MGERRLAPPVWFLEGVNSILGQKPRLGWGIYIPQGFGLRGLITYRVEAQCRPSGVFAMSAGKS